MTEAAVLESPKIETASATTPKTMAELRDWKPEDGFKYEWKHGQIIKTAKAITGRQLYIAANLQRAFAKTAAYESGSTLICELQSDLDDDHYRIPDMGFFTRKQLVAASFGAPILPAFCIEIISDSESYKKALAKVDDYFKAGVQVVWHIFPDLQIVHVFLPSGEIFRRRSEQICSAAPAVPDFEISVAEIFKL